MSVNFWNPTSRIAISARIAETQRRTQSRDELIVLGEHDFADVPITRAEARAEALKWFWQH